MKSLNTNLEHSLAMVERMGIGREQLQRQLMEMEVAKAESEHLWEEATVEDQQEIIHFKRKLEANHDDIDCGE